MTEQEYRVKMADNHFQIIENTLLAKAVFESWGERRRVEDAVRELYKIAVEPRG